MCIWPDSLDGDELVILRVVDPASSSNISLPPAAASSTTLLPDSLISEACRAEAHELLEMAMERNSSLREDPNSSIVEPLREISITVETVVARVFDGILKLLIVYRPDALVCGTRGKDQTLFKPRLGSVSR